MKSKLVILSLVLAGLATVATAQTKDRYYAESAKDNYFISIGVGAQVCVNPDNSDYGMGKAMTPLFNLSVGKLINPVWGVRAQVAGFNTKLNSDFINGDNGVYDKVDNSYFTLRADGMFNISNAIAGYNPDRVFEGYAFLGPQVQFAKAEIGGNDKTKALVGGTLGLGGAFNINQFWAINVEVRGEVGQSPFGDYSSAVADGAVGATVGATYFFGGKKFVKVNNMDLYNALNGDIKKYKELLAQEQADHNVTKDELAKAKAKPAETIVKEVEVPYAAPRAIFFTIGSAKIDSKGKVNLEMAAKVMKENTAVKYVVVGYADKATGSAAGNMKLSEKRAKAVYDALI
ncbi:MAG: OmpA family protein, partial [Coprobacter sp.]|nr:OmpA family protein [Coprobacter sp.]